MGSQKKRRAKERRREGRARKGHAEGPRGAPVRYRPRIISYWIHGHAVHHHFHGVFVFVLSCFSYFLRRTWYNCSDSLIITTNKSLYITLLLPMAFPPPNTRVVILSPSRLFSQKVESYTNGGKREQATSPSCLISPSTKSTRSLVCDLWQGPSKHLGILGVLGVLGTVLLVLCFMIRVDPAGDLIIPCRRPSRLATRSREGFTDGMAPTRVPAARIADFQGV
jgi:hypothetical protein